MKNRERELRKQGFTKEETMRLLWDEEENKVWEKESPATLEYKKFILKIMLTGMFFNLF